jgi:hypothetical protein
MKKQSRYTPRIWAFSSNLTRHVKATQNDVTFANGLRCNGKTGVSTALNALLELYAGNLQFFGAAFLRGNAATHLLLGAGRRATAPSIVGLLLSMLMRATPRRPGDDVID